MSTPRQHLDAGRPQQALGQLVQHLGQDGQDADAWALAAEAFAALGRWSDAHDAVGQALRAEPGHVEAVRMQGRVLQHEGRPAEAEQVLRRAVDRTGDAGVAADLGWLRLRRARYDEAQSAFLAALEARPGMVSALSGLGLLAERRGHPERTVEGLSALVRRQPEPALVYAWGRGMLGCKRGPEAIRTVRRGLDRARRTTDRVDLLHTLGACHEQAGDHAAAFDAIARANALRPRRFDGPRHLDAVRTLTRCFPRPGLARPTPRRGRSLLVVGVPRSGTSLVETMLARHPDIAPGGELESWRLLALELGRESGSDPWYRFPERIGADHLDAVARSYAADLDRIDPDAARVVDKMPDNVLNVGLAAWAAPDTVVVHCVRDPADTAWSCFRLSLGAGLPYTASLAGLGWWIRAERELMAHWKASLDVPVVTVRYEDLVVDPAGTLRPVIAACGLPWRDEVAVHDGTARAVATASHAQVRQPLYTRSVGRSRPYHGFMGDFFRVWEAGAVEAA